MTHLPTQISKGIQEAIDKAAVEKFELFKGEFLLRNLHSAAGIALRQKRHIQEYHFLKRYCHHFPTHQCDKISFALQIYREATTKEETIDNAVAFSDLTPTSAAVFHKENHLQFLKKMKITFS